MEASITSHRPADPRTCSQLSSTTSNSRSASARTTPPIGFAASCSETLAGLACVAAIAGDQATATAAVGEARAALSGRHQPITAAALRYADGIMAWHQGRLADAEHLAREATVAWHRCCDRMDACDGIELLGVLAQPVNASPTPHACSPPPKRPGGRCCTWHPDSPLIAAPPHGPPARPGTSSAKTASRGVEEGQGLTLDDAVAYAARKGGGRKRPTMGWASLTPAELEVVRLVGEGLRNDAIARRLFIAPGTVKVHLSHIFGKLAITTRAELAAQAASRELTTGYPDE